MTRCPQVHWSLLIAGLLLGGAPVAAQAVPQASTPGASYTIAGTVVSKADGNPLARARIFVRNVRDLKNVQSMVTSEDGRFAFHGVPAGKYALAGAKRGFITAAYDEHEQFSSAIVTGAGLDTENLVLRLPPAALISGKVLDEVGEPVRHATVRLYRYDNSQGVGQVHGFRNVQTDDQGSYEFELLVPGTYFLSASATPWYAVHPPSNEGEQAGAPTDVDRTLDVAYPLTYYADVTEADEATPIPVRGGDSIQAEIHLNPVPALRLLFRVPEDASHGYNFPQLQQSSFDGSTFVQGSNMRLVSPGVVEVAGIPAGRYDVRIRENASSVQMTGVDLSSDGQEVDTSTGEALSTVKVSVRILGETGLPSRLAVGLRSGRRVLAASPLNAKGEAELQQIAPGRYDILVWGPDKPYSIVRMAANGAEVSGHKLAVAAGSSPAVRLTVVTGTNEVRGVVKQAGKPFAGAMVVLVPKDPETGDLFRRDQSDQDGTFTLHDVVAGSYTVLAIADGWDLDWLRPGVIAAYLKHGQTIEIGNRRGDTTDLPEPVEVQPK